MCFVCGVCVCLFMHGISIEWCGMYTTRASTVRTSLFDIFGANMLMNMSHFMCMLYSVFVAHFARSIENVSISLVQIPKMA